MRKSIYYLIANALSTLAAVIFIACLNPDKANYPVFGPSLEIIESASVWTPMIFVLPVLALSIIIMVQDVVSFYNNGQNHSRVPFTKTKNIVMGIITVVSILYTWAAIILECDGYNQGIVSLPLFFVIFYAVAVILIFLSPLVSKKNQGVGAALVLSSILLMISGLLYELLPYWYTLLAALGVTVIVFAVLSILSLKNSKR